MRQIKKTWIPAIMLILGLVLIGCDNGMSPVISKDGITWTLEQIGGTVTAGTPDSSSSGIRIKFGVAVDNLLNFEVAIGGAASLGSGDFVKEGNNWTIPINVTSTDNALVTIKKSGVEPGPRTVMVYKQGDAVPIDWTATADGISNTISSKKINFVFTADVNSLTAGEISISAGTGSASKGELTGSGKNWILDISNVKEGNISVSIAKTGISATPKTLAIYEKDAVLNSAKSLTITGLGNERNEFEVMVVLVQNRDDIFNIFEDDIFNIVETEEYEFAGDGDDVIDIIFETEKIEIAGDGYVENGTAVITLYNEDGPWTGTGSWYVVLLLINESYGEMYISAEKVNFITANTVRPFSNFKRYTFANNFDDLAEFLEIDISDMTLGDFIEAVFEEFSELFEEFGELFEEVFEEYGEIFGENGIQFFKDEEMTIPYEANELIAGKVFYFYIPIALFLDEGVAVPNLSPIDEIEAIRNSIKR